MKSFFGRAYEASADNLSDSNHIQAKRTYETASKRYNDAGDAESKARVDDAAKYQDELEKKTKDHRINCNWCSIL